MNRRTSEDRGDRAGIDDTAITARHHDACRLAGKSEAGGEIGCKDPLEIAILPFRERPAMLNSCIVDEDIEIAMPVDDIGDGSRAGLGIANTLKAANSALVILAAALRSVSGSRPLSTTRAPCPPVPRRLPSQARARRPSPAQCVP